MTLGRQRRAFRSSGGPGPRARPADSNPSAYTQSRNDGLSGPERLSEHRSFEAQGAQPTTPGRLASHGPASDGPKARLDVVWTQRRASLDPAGPGAAVGMAPDPHRTVGPGSICFELAGAADTPATTHFPFPAEPARAATVDDCGVGAPRQKRPGFRHGRSACPRSRDRDRGRCCWRASVVSVAGS